MPKFVIKPTFQLTLTSHYIEADNIKEAQKIAEELPPHLATFLEELNAKNEVAEIEHEFTYVFAASHGVKV